MPVSCKIKNGKWRIVGPDGKIEKNDNGTAVDGGGHSTKNKCQRQANAINANSGENKMDENKTTAPQNACIFDRDCSVVFADSGDEDKNKNFSIVAYSGQVIENHWWWGNLAFDLAGIKFAKKRTPVLLEHFRSDRIGFSTNQDVADRVTLEGKFLSNSKASELRRDMADGFPMQASVYLPPKSIEYVKEGESVTVNGHLLRGPGTVFRKGEIQEVSMCTLGADSHTQSKAFADGGKQEIGFNVIEKEHVMAKEQKSELTAETFAAEHPDLFEEITEKAKAEGRDEAVKRFKSIVEVCEDDYEMTATLFVDGAGRSKALQERNRKLSEQLKKAGEEVKKSAKLASKDNVDPAVSEFSDDAEKNRAADKGDKPKTDEERFTDEFNTDKDIQAEFGGPEGLDDYIAYRKAEEKGLVHIAGKR